MSETAVKKLNDFYAQGKAVNYKPREIILRAGEPIFGVFLLKKGYVRQYLISEDGDEVTIHLYRPDTFFPITLLIAKAPNRYYFEAETAVETYRLPPEKVIEFVKQNPDVLFSLSERFAQAIVGLSKRVESLALGSVYAKVISTLSYLANRFGEEKDGQIVIYLPITHNEISAWIGAKRETVSRQMEKLSKAEIVAHYKHFLVIKDKKKLAQELKLYHEEEF